MIITAALTVVTASQLGRLTGGRRPVDARPSVTAPATDPGRGDAASTGGQVVAIDGRSPVRQRAAARRREERSETDLAEWGRRRLVAWASDDLRIPIEQLRSMAEYVHTGVPSDPDALRRVQRSMLDEIGRMSALVEDLATLAGTDPGARCASPGAKDPDRVFDLAYVSAGHTPDLLGAEATG